MTDTAFVILVGLFFAAAIYLLLSRALIRMLLGVVLLVTGYLTADQWLSLVGSML